MKTYRHPKLNLLFQKVNNGILFQDDVFYTSTEIEILKKNKPENLKTIHMVKKMFDGVIDKIEH